MSRRLPWLGALFCMIALAAYSQQPAPPKTHLKAGQPAPVTFPLLSDWHRKVTKHYGLFNEKTGYSARATTVIDKEGIIRHVEEGRTAIDPTGAYQACSIFDKKKS